MRFNHHPYVFREFVDSLIAGGIKNLYANGRIPIS